MQNAIARLVRGLIYGYETVKSVRSCFEEKQDSDYYEILCKSEDWKTSVIEELPKLYFLNSSSNSKQSVGSTLETIEEDGLFFNPSYFAIVSENAGATELDDQRDTVSKYNKVEENQVQAVGLKAENVKQQQSCVSATANNSEALEKAEENQVRAASPEVENVKQQQSSASAAANSIETFCPSNFRKPLDELLSKYRDCPVETFG